MKKLLHERLREGGQDYFVYSVGLDSGCIVLTDPESEKLADEIEKYYIPRPRYEDGEPVEYKSETEYGTVLGFVTYLGGFDYESVGLLTLENDIVLIPKRELLKRQNREADSYEKLRDDMRNNYGNWKTDPNEWLDYADRLTALMERDA